MQVPAPFEYERATSVDNALELLERLGPEARVVAGGHSLLPMMKLRLAVPEYLVDINDLAGRARLHPRRGRRDPDRRAHPPPRASSLSDTLDVHFPIFRDAERVIADPPVRNRGTIGGALCQADPAEDLSAVCAACHAQAVIRSTSGERVVLMDEFHQGPYETAVGDGEMLVEVRLPMRSGPGQRVREGRAPRGRLGGRRDRRRAVDRGRRDHRAPASA